MNVVTITCDWGKEDYYLGCLKGRFSALGADFSLVEISRSIPSHDVQNEAFVLKNCYKSFPPGSIHLLGVFSEPNSSEKMVILFYDGYYFIGLNDGRFSYLFENPPAMAFEIMEIETDSTFLSIEYFIKGVKIIAENNFEAQTRAAELKRESLRRAVYNEDTIIGRVIHVDSFGNAVANIDRLLFERICKGRSFTIFVQGPYLKCTTLKNGYGECEAGEVFALFNSADLLEIGRFGLNLATLENIDNTTEIRIKFNR